MVRRTAIADSSQCSQKTWEARLIDCASVHVCARACVRLPTGVLGPHAGLEPQLAYVSLLIQSCLYFARTLNVTHGDAALAANMTSASSVECFSLL